MIKKLYKNRYFLLVMQLCQIAMRDDVERRHFVMKKTNVQGSQGCPTEYRGCSNAY